MNRVRLGATGFQVSSIGFGGAQLMGRVSSAEGRRALDLAFDLGVNYFDTARAYGYGESESLLGRFLRGKRDQVFVATKFGIDAARANILKRAAKSVLRPVFRAAPFLRKAAKGRLGHQFVAGNYSRTHLLESLHRSLRELRTDYVDILHVHECGPDIWTNDDTFGCLEDMVRAGKIRTFGVAADTSAFAGWERSAARIHVAQFPFSLFDQRASEVVLDVPASKRVGMIAYQPFGGGGSHIGEIRKKLDQFRASPAVPLQLRRKLEKITPTTLADLAINAVIRAAKVNVVLCSMIEKAHIRANLAAADATAFTVEELDQIRAFFAS